MVTLVGAADDSEADVVWTISEDVVDATEYFQVDDEIVQVLANFHSSIYAPTGETTPPKIRVKRGAGGTSTEAHDDGTTLTPVIPPSTGTGGTGETNVYVQPTDPGVVGAGKLWVDDTTVEPVTIRVRNAADDAWLDLLFDYKSLARVILVAAGDGTSAGGEIEIQEASDPIGGFALLTGGNGDGEGGIAQLKGGNSPLRQGALIKAWGGTDGEDEEGGGRIEIIAGSGTDDAVGASILMGGADNTGAGVNGGIEIIAHDISFDLVDPPEVPASPTEQDIVDALLGLGLTTQALTGGFGAGVRSATVDLDAADIATLSSVPVEVVAAPGAGKVIVPVAASFQYKAGAVAFDFASGIDLAFDGVAATGFISSGEINFEALNDQVAILAVTGAFSDQSNIANQPLVIEALAEPDGAGDGTARLQVLYFVMDLA